MHAAFHCRLPRKPLTDRTIYFFMTRNAIQTLVNPRQSGKDFWDDQRPKWDEKDNCEKLQYLLYNRALWTARDGLYREVIQAPSLIVAQPLQ